MFPKYMMLLKYSICFLGLLIVSNSQPAWSDMISTEGLKPWEVCGLCHQINGISFVEKFPILAGQKAKYIEKQLRDFRGEVRQNDGGQMAAIATEITEEQIPEVATYFSSLTPATPKPHDLDAAMLSRAQSLFNKGDSALGIQACKTCHLETNEAWSYAPHLFSQHEGYIQKQLTDFKEENRTNDINNVMRGIASKLSENDITVLAKYLAAQPLKKTNKSK